MSSDIVNSWTRSGRGSTRCGARLVTGRRVAPLEDGSIEKDPDADEVYAELAAE